MLSFMPPPLRPPRPVAYVRSGSTIASVVRRQSWRGYPRETLGSFLVTEQIPAAPAKVKA